MVDVQKKRQFESGNSIELWEGSQTGPLEDGTWGILAICLSFVLSYKLVRPSLCFVKEELGCDIENMGW